MASRYIMAPVGYDVMQFLIRSGMLSASNDEGDMGFYLIHEDSSTEIQDAVENAAQDCGDEEEDVEDRDVVKYWMGVALEEKADLIYFYR